MRTEQPPLASRYGLARGVSTVLRPHDPRLYIPETVTSFRHTIPFLENILRFGSLTYGGIRCTSFKCKIFQVNIQHLLFNFTYTAYMLRCSICESIFILFSVMNCHLYLKNSEYNVYHFLRFGSYLQSL